MSTDEGKKSEEDLLQELTELSNSFTQAMKEVENEQEDFWNSLSAEDKIKAFCAVTRRIHEGELVKRGTYRYVLYNVFGFGPEAYVQAQCAGYLDIHNALFSYEEIHDKERRAVRDAFKLAQIRKILEVKDEDSSMF